MFPDRAALYVVAIEDRQYKDFKIHCKSPLHSLLGFWGGWGGRKHFRVLGRSGQSRGHSYCASVEFMPVTFSGFFSLDVFRWFQGWGFYREEIRMWLVGGKARRE